MWDTFSHVEAALPGTGFFLARGFSLVDAAAFAQCSQNVHDEVGPRRSAGRHFPKTLASG